MMDTPHPIPKAAEPSSVRLVVTLAFAGFLSGLIIVTMFESTLASITAHRDLILEQSVLKVLPGAVSLRRMVFRDGRLTIVERERDGEEMVLGGYAADGPLVGYAIPGAGSGFADTIRLLYGYLPEGRKVVGMEVLESRETPGSGDKIYKDAAFVANFASLSVDPEIVAVKKGKKSAPNQIDAITGATISSKAVVKIINAANTLWLPRLEAAPGSETETTTTSTQDTKE
ncbi:MAG: FMN-binding protein [Chromatiaceae bacterium]|nr:FMN-binding protein [Chromatiaceae bacterium]MBP8290397.1 FMN-binding protein [Chromatiaceae bacterium]